MSFESAAGAPPLLLSKTRAFPSLRFGVVTGVVCRSFLLLEEKGDDINIDAPSTNADSSSFLDNSAIISQSKTLRDGVL